MPADVFVLLSSEDFGAIIAYLKTVPSIGNKLPEPDLIFIGRIMLGAGMFGDVFPADYIDHNQPFPAMLEIGAKVEYGSYLAVLLCSGCHGADFSGQVFDPEAPVAPNLAPGGLFS